MCKLAQEIIDIMGMKNILGDQQSCVDQVLFMDWCLLPWMFDGISKEYSHPHTDRFASRMNTKLPLYVSPVSDPKAGKENAFQHWWDDVSVYAFPHSIF